MLLAVGAVVLVVGLAVIISLGESSNEAGEPAWSPDGKTIAYTYENQALADDIRAARSDGSEVRVLVEGSEVEDPGSPDWSPDGRKIAFGGTDGLYVMDAHGSGVRRLLRSKTAWEPTWSPNGKLLAYVDDRGISVIGPDGTGNRRVTSDPSDLAPDWSPDGRRLVFDTGKAETRLVIVGLDAGAREPLVTLHGEEDADPVWSPDGSQIAFVQHPSDGAEYELRLLTVDTGAQALVRTCEGLCSDPAWHPDGIRIAFAESSKIAIVRSDGSGYKVLHE